MNETPLHDMDPILFMGPGDSAGHWDFYSGGRTNTQLDACKKVFKDFENDFSNLEEDNLMFSITCYPQVGDNKICPTQNRRYVNRRIFCYDLLKKEQTRLIAQSELREEAVGEAPVASAEEPVPAESVVSAEPAANVPADTDDANPSSPNLDSSTHTIINLDPADEPLDSSDNTTTDGNDSGGSGDEGGGSGGSDEGDGDDSDDGDDGDGGGDVGEDSNEEEVAEKEDSIPMTSIASAPEERGPVVTARLSSDEGENKINKEILCEALDAQIPKLMDDLNNADAKIDKDSCNIFKGAINGISDSTFKENNPLEDLMGELDCEDTSEINYGKLRRLYNKLVARGALLDEIDNYKIILKTPSTPEKLVDRSLYRLSVMRETFGELSSAITSGETDRIREELNKSICTETGPIPDVNKCKQLFDADFFQKLKAVLKIAAACETGSEGAAAEKKCKEDNQALFEKLDVRVTEILKSYTDSENIDAAQGEEGPSAPIGNLTTTQMTVASDEALTSMCEMINNDVIMRNSGRPLSAFRNELYSPKNRQADIREEFEEIYNCEFDPDDGSTVTDCIRKINTDDNLKEAYNNASDALGDLLSESPGDEIKDTPGKEIKELRDFLNASVAAHQNICAQEQNNQRVDRAGELFSPNCSENQDEYTNTNLKLFISNAQGIVHKLDEFTTFDLSENSQRASFDKLLAMCRPGDREKYEQYQKHYKKFCGAMDNVETRLYSKSEDAERHQRFMSEYENQCSGLTGCTLDTYYDEEKGEMSYRSYVHPGVPVAGSTAGYVAKGALEGAFGVGQQYYFNQMNPMQSLMNSYSFGKYGIPALENYSTNYLVPMLTYRNAYYSQLAEAQMATMFGTPYVFNYSLLYPNQSFTQMDAIYNFGKQVIPSITLGSR